jgi:hypothetical protein
VLVIIKTLPDHDTRITIRSAPMLEIAGLTPAEESVYLTLLDLPPVTAERRLPGVQRGEPHRGADHPGHPD